MHNGPPPELNAKIIYTHGGLGDIIWVYKKLHKLNEPIFLQIAVENRTRPRRSGFLVDHLPNIVGWNWGDETFAPGGQDWTPNDKFPGCAIGKKWSELNIKPNVPFRLECNRWLEGGRRLEDWLPDLETTHHFPFLECKKPNIQFKSPSVVFHLAGWPDIPEPVWIQACNLIRNVAHIYIVGGSYDYRPRQLYNKIYRNGNITLLEDVQWEDLYGILKHCNYCVGHASGFTAMADVLKVPGATFNPRSVPKLIGTWNSLEHKDMVHIDRVDDFNTVIHTIFEQLSGIGVNTWPPDKHRFGQLRIEDDNPLTPYKAIGKQKAYSIAVVVGEQGNIPDQAPSLVLRGSYDSGNVVRNMYLVNTTPEALSLTYKATMASTVKPVIDIGDLPWPGCKRHEIFDTIIFSTNNKTKPSCSLALELWQSIGNNGSLFINGPSSKTVAEFLTSMLKIDIVPLENTTDWFHLRRGI